MRVTEQQRRTGTGATATRATVLPRATGGTLQLQPTGRTNVAGIHGPAAAAGPHGPEELPRELMHAALKDAARLGYERLEIGGGEPFLHAGLPGLLARARRLDFVTTLTTNGMLLGQARRWAPVAPLIDFLWVTIDGDEAQHDRLSGREGAYAQTIRNLEVVRESGVPFGFSTTLMNSTLPGLEDVVRRAAAEGASAVQLTPLAATGRAAATLLSELPAGEALDAAVSAAQRLGRELGLAIQVDAVTRDELVLYRGSYVPRFPSRDLAALSPILIVESTGTVRPLSGATPDRLVIGNLHRRRLADMAPVWMGSGRAAEYAGACERTWWALADPSAAPSAHWAGEVAARLVADEAAALLVA